jgi:hypothetical protein
MKHIYTITTVAVFSLALLAGCGDAGHDESGHGHDHENGDHEHEQDQHAHDDGPHDHDNGNAHQEHDGEHGHEHEEYKLGTFEIEGMEIQAKQGNKQITPGQKAHLIIKLSDSNEGATIVRAWIGTEDRTKSIVAKGEYAPSHDDYDLHTMAPDPLPDNAKWWVEIEHPDRTTAVGSIPLYEDEPQSTKDNGTNNK